MSTPTLEVVVPARPLTNNHALMAARLQAREEAHQAANMVASLPAKVRSTPRKVIEFLRLPAIWNKIKGAAGVVGGWLSKVTGPAAGAVATVGIIPASLLAATGEFGQATVRWVAKSVWGIFSWTFRSAGTFLDGALRMFGRPGNWMADMLMLGTTQAVKMAAVPLGMAYAVAAPLVSAKSGHVKLINRLARLVVVHRIVRMFVRNPIIAWPLELFIDLVVIGKMEQALKATTETAEMAALRLQETANEAKAKAAVDAHLVGQTAQNAKVRMTTTVEANRDTTIPQAMGKIGEHIEGVSKKADEFFADPQQMFDNLTSPAASASPGTATSGTESSDSSEGEASTAVGDQPGQPVETAEQLAVRLQAEGKIGLVTTPASATREEMLDGAQRAADKLGEDVVAVLPTGESVVVEPTGTVETVIEAEGPEMDEEAPVSRGTERALQHAGVGKRKQPNNRRK